MVVILSWDIAEKRNNIDSYYTYSQKRTKGRELVR